MSFRQGARQFFERRGGGAPTARDYVQDGLIAMWDGIENAGWGTHDPNATVWKDLAGNRDWTSLPNNFKWGEKSASSTIDGWWNADPINQESEDWQVQYVHIEVCGRCFAGKNSWFCFGFGNSRMFGVLSTNNRGFQFASNKPTMHGDFYQSWTVAATLDASNNITSCFYNAEARTASMGTSNWNLASYVRFGESSSWKFYGEIFNLRLYSRALTAAEVAANYAIDKARFNLP